MPKNNKKAPVETSTEAKAESTPRYGKITSGEPVKKPKPAEKKVESKPLPFSFGKITPPKVDEKQKKAAPGKRQPLKKPSNGKKPQKKQADSKANAAKAVPFNRDRIFADVFGYAYDEKPQTPEKPVEKVVQKPTSPTKPSSAPKPTAETNPRNNAAVDKPVQAQSKTEFDRDRIFAEVFGYEYAPKAIEADFKTIHKSISDADKQQANSPQANKELKRRASHLYLMFSNHGKKKRPDFVWVKPSEKSAENAPTKPESAKSTAFAFDRDRIFAEVFGYEYKQKTVQAPAEKAVKAEQKSAEKKVEIKTEKQAQSKEKHPPIDMDAELKQLITDSYTGDYPKYNIRRPFTESEKRWARDFESFYASRGQKVNFKVSGATKTGIITQKLLQSGSAADVLHFFAVAKRITAQLLSLNEDDFQRTLMSGSNPNHYFDARFLPIIKTAESYGLVTKHIEYKNEKNEFTNVRAFFSKYPKVLDYFKGEFLESFGYYIAKNVAASVSKKFGVSCEVAANLLTTDSDGKVIHEYDTVARLSNQVFIIEEKSSPYFCDFNKFAQDMDKLQFNKQNYMILLVNKDAEEAEAIEWLFDFRIANMETYAQKLEQMFEEALNDPIAEV